MYTEFRNPMQNPRSMTINNKKGDILESSSSLVAVWCGGGHRSLFCNAMMMLQRGTIGTMWCEGTAAVKTRNFVFSFVELDD